ncbi:aromatic ring-hydroxylating dioxygenase subunit alpha [uncultured Parasphingorhabdus sp.]|uniref:aromatic ring-hydroxylating oxygenase subunit alpha n=1 Tax=uncultured Parasphingorhabdus sp. TaxID=2709694 RepID=UPI002AA6033C|nr:aromatic ring-hydroxylating dioxygenase subunit alpha [uncultured Parasphingorhabdus sp.]
MPHPFIYINVTFKIDSVLWLFIKGDKNGVSTPMKAAAKQKLYADTQEMLDLRNAGTVRRARQVATLDASKYTDEVQFAAEQERIFKRLPLMLAASCELIEPGSYKTMDIAGVPVLLVRGKDGLARAFLNSCPHRASPVAKGCGKAARFTCPYHGWTFGREGNLIGIAARESFGDIDPDDNGLLSFPVHEQSGLIWAILDPDAPADFSSFLGEFTEMLGGFGFENWHFGHRTTLEGTNWKLAFDAHLEFYHLPVLHRKTFGTEIANAAQYQYHGPHFRLRHVGKRSESSAPDSIAFLEGLSQEEWSTEPLFSGEWILFPNVSINSFFQGGRGVIISQVLPGNSVGESVTIQTYLHEHRQNDEDRAAGAELTAFIAHVVREEDLPMSKDQQHILLSGLQKSVQFGRNEGGLQHFHRWVQHCISMDETHPLAELVMSAPSIP